MKKNSVLIYVIAAAPLILTSILIYGCSCACGTQAKVNIPLNVLQKANHYIISKTGKEFFDKYITPNFEKTKYIQPNYHMVYNFFIPEKPFVNALITFDVDTAGTVLMNKEISGIPDCVLDSSLCGFSVDKETAIKIAESSGLEKGIKPWKCGFIWSAKFKRYVWDVITTFIETKTPDGEKGSGRYMTIDANSGKVLEANEWNIH